MDICAKCEDKSPPRPSWDMNWSYVYEPTTWKQEASAEEYRLEC